MPAAGTSGCTADRRHLLTALRRAPILCLMPSRLLIGLARSAVAAACVAACASSGGSGASAPEPIRQVAVDADHVFTNTQDAGVSAALDADPARAFAAVRSAIARLGIPIGTMDPNARTVGNTNFMASHTLNGEALSTFVDCGMNNFAPRANTYRIYFSILSTVSPANGGKSTVATQVVANALDASQGNGERVPCSSKGVLERRIHDTAAAQLKP